MLIMSNDTKEQLDRLGLPRHPTEESVFPPLSFRVPIVDNSRFNRSQILEATNKSRYLGVNLDAFNVTGHSKFPHHNIIIITPPPMTDDDGDHEKSNDDSIWSLQMRHVDPPIFTIDNFLSSNECDYLSSLINDDDNNNDSNDKQVKRMSSPTFSSSTTLYPNIHQLYMVLCSVDILPFLHF
jgi:hypothetical protein